MKFYSPSEFKKLNENSDIHDFYIHIAAELADKSIDIIKNNFSDNQYTFDGLDFFSFGNREDAQKALEYLNSENITIIDSNLETNITDDLNEAFQSTILANLENNFKNDKYNNFYKELVSYGLDVSRVTDDDVTIIYPNDLFKEPYKSNKNIVIVTNDDPVLKDILLKENIISKKEAQDSEILIGLFRNGASIGFNGKEGHVGIMENMKDKYDRERISTVFTKYLNDKNVGGFNSLFGSDEKIEFDGKLNQRNVVKIATKAYAIDILKNKVSDIKNARYKQKIGATALIKDADIIKSNIARYKKNIAENTNISLKVKELFDGYIEIINIVIESNSLNRNIYDQLDNCTSIFNNAMRYMSEYYSYLSAAKRYEDKGDDSKYEMTSAISSKERFVSYYKEFFKKKEDCLKILNNEGSIQN